MSKNLALFDFDGTVTNCDSMLDFVSFHFGKGRMRRSLLILAPNILAMKTRLTPPQKVKEKMLRMFFDGMTRTHINDLGEKYCRERVPEIIRPKALEKILWHINEGHDVYVVSASCEAWIAPWCRSKGMGIIASKLAYSNEVFSGTLDGLNCNKEEKVKRIKAEVDLDAYSNIYAYGDTNGDRAMLDLATHPHYREFG